MIRCAVPLARRLVLAAGALVLAHGTPAVAQETVPPTSVPQFLRLQDAIDIALRSSNQVGIEEAQLFAAHKARLNAWFNLGPDLGLDASHGKATRHNLAPDDSAAAHGNPDAESTSRSRGVSSSVRLFDGFSNYWRIAASHKDIEAQTQTVEYTRQQVTELVVQTYFELLRAKLLLTVAQEGEKVARDQLDRTKALYELGSAARSDVLKQQVQHDNTRLTLVKAEQGQRQAEVDLIWAMNLESATPFDIDTTVSRIQWKTKDFNVEREYALMHRANLLSFRAQETASGYRVWESRGALLPTLDFRYSFSRSSNEERGGQFSFNAGETSNRSWSFFANWNIWDRYLNYANIGQAKARHRIAEYDRRQAELDAIREVRRLVNTIDEAHERLTVSRQNVESAREDLRLAQEKFRVGAGTILDTVQAQSDLTLARANEVQAIVDYLIARAQLARATGRPLSEV